MNDEYKIYNSLSSTDFVFFPIKLSWISYIR